MSERKRPFVSELPDSHLIEMDEPTGLAQKLEQQIDEITSTLLDMHKIGNFSEDFVHKVMSTTNELYDLFCAIPEDGIIRDGNQFCKGCPYFKQVDAEQGLYECVVDMKEGQQCPAVAACGWRVKQEQMQ